MFKISEFSKLTALTIRTLQYYDEIGLVVSKREANGHRVYTYEHLVKVKEIVLLKNIGFKLDAIMEYMNAKKDFNLKSSLIRQKEILTSRLSEIETQIKDTEHLITCCDDEHQLEKEIINQTFIENSPLKDRLSTIWNLDFDELSDLNYIRNHNKTPKFDSYFLSLSKLQSYDVSDDCVQNELSNFVSYLCDFYGGSFNVSSISELATFYRENKEAKEHLLQYGDSFNELLSRVILYYSDSVKSE